MKKSTKQAWEVGAGLTAAAALAAAGAYLLSGKQGAKRKAKVKAWVVKARVEAARNIKAAKKMSAQDYTRIVDKAIKHYGALQKATAPEILKAAKEARAEWKNIQAHAKKLAAKKRPAKKPIKRKTSHKSRK